MCRKNFGIVLAHCSLCGSVVEHRSAESKGLSFDSSWGLKSFSLSHACDQTKNTFPNYKVVCKKNADCFCDT